MEMLPEVSHCACRSRIRRPGLTGSGSTGAVVERDGMKQVFIGGALIGQFEIAGRDHGPRNVLLVTRAKEPTMHYGHPRQSTAICDEMSILIDGQMHSRRTQVENRPLIMRSERWLAM